jgi:DNA recombination protein RmuC
MEMIFYMLIAIIAGLVIGWLLAKTKANANLQSEKEAAQTKYNDLEKKWVFFETNTVNELKTANLNLSDKQNELNELKQKVRENEGLISSLKDNLSTSNANLLTGNQTILDKNKEIDEIKGELKSSKSELDKHKELLATANANNKSLNEKLETQKAEMEELGKKFNLEFENIANKIFDSKTEKFTELNKTNLNTILEPLGKNITEFKTKVEEVYEKESKERFSLGEKVKELAQLNKVISEEAHNLTKALKSESKTQGGWGEMILESILEKSGLVKDREYFMEHQLLDENGNPMKSDSEDKKMRPDAVIKYPDNRHVIIDSKVSLNAFIRCVNATDEESRLKELAEHIACIKKHISLLSAKGYDDYNKSLDFVMMFIPSEPAYIAALQGDADLWNFAYDRRILLLSPTNLITSLKLIVDLWKREYQNQNALEIAERGAKLYDKFVGFVANLEDVGEHLEKAQGKYMEAYKQLSTGNDNLVSQATKLKNLGLKTKKQLSQSLVENSVVNEAFAPLDEEISNN